MYGYTNRWSAWRSLFVLTMIWAPASSRGQTSVPRNYLSSKAQQLNYSLAQHELDTWRSAQKQLFRQGIDALPDSIKDQLADKAEKALSYTWPALPASVYLEFKLTGNRSHYEQKLGERRSALSSLVIGELIKKDKKYLSQ